MAHTYQVAAIPGDGIGQEVLPAGIMVLEAAARRFDWGCERYVRTGKLLPDGGLEELVPLDAIYLGAVGHPSIPDHISLWGLLIPIRRRFRQYVNLRPVRLLPGIASPLKDASPERINFCVVRENNEGEYSEIGGRLYPGTEDEMAV